MGILIINSSKKIIYTLSVCLVLYFFAGCSQEAATVVVSPVTGTLPSEDTGTLYPMIQKVYPGALQSLDIPQSYPDDVSPEYPGIVIIFSHVMENGKGELNTAIELVDVSSDQIAINVQPSSSSRYFTISPVSGNLNADTEYVLRVYKYAAAETLIATASVSRDNNRAVIETSLRHGLSDNELVTISGFTGSHSGYNASLVSVKVESSTAFSYPNSGSDENTADDTGGSVNIFSRTLVFDNLVIPPAVTISPADPVYVEYKFKTGGFISSDITPPSVAYTSISDGDVNVTADPVVGDGYIEIVFYDNRIPMIDPSTVNDKSVTLYNTTAGTAVTGTISCIYTDTDYKTFRFYPYPDTYLLPSTEYRLRVSVSSFPVTDFAGNSVTQADIYFSTAP